MRHFFITLCSFLLTQAIPARADYNPDVTAESASGRFRIEARSPDNAPEKAGGHHDNQGHFEYSMIDTTTGKTLWTRKQPEPVNGGSSEAVPDKVFAGDGGVAVVRAEDDEVFLLDSSGKKTLSLFVYERFSIRENAEFTDGGGPRSWSGNARFYFLDVKADESTISCFIIRTYWGHRIVLDLTAGAVLADDKIPAAIHAAAKEAEEAWVRGVLEKFGKKAETSKYPVEGMSERGFQDRLDLECAMFMAGAGDMRDLIPALKKLEKCHVQGSVGMGQHDVTFHEDGVRQACQTALRRLGESPREPPGIEVNVGKRGDSKELESSVSVRKRASHAGEILKDMTLEETVKAIGFPDFQSGRENMFEYDMDGTEPFTLRVHFDDDFAKVTWVQRVEVPAWKKVSKRDKGIGW